MRLLLKEICRELLQRIVRLRRRSYCVHDLILKNASHIIFRPDGEEVAVTHGDSEAIDFLSTSSGQINKLLPGVGYGLGTATYSADGKLLAAGSYSFGTIKVWDLASMKERVRLASLVFRSGIRQRGNCNSRSSFQARGRRASILPRTGGCWRSPKGEARRSYSIWSRRSPLRCLLRPMRGRETWRSAPMARLWCRVDGRAYGCGGSLQLELVRTDSSLWFSIPYFPDPAR